MSVYDHSSPSVSVSPDSLLSPDSPDSQWPYPMDDLDVLKRDRFELLSAYLDGEVTAQERKQVEAWLATDPEFQRLHRRLLKLNHSVQSLPIPATKPTEQTVRQVMHRLDHRPKLMLIWSGLGATAAAAVVGAVSLLLPNNSPFPLGQTTASIQSPATTALPSVTPEDPHAGLMLALDRPPVEIPNVSPTSASFSNP